MLAFFKKLFASMNIQNFRFLIALSALIAFLLVPKIYAVQEDTGKDSHTYQPVNNSGGQENSPTGYKNALMGKLFEMWKSLCNNPAISYLMKGLFAYWNLELLENQNLFLKVQTRYSPQNGSKLQSLFYHLDNFLINTKSAYEKYYWIVESIMCTQIGLYDGSLAYYVVPCYFVLLSSFWLGDFKYSLNFQTLISRFFNIYILIVYSRNSKNTETTIKTWLNRIFGGSLILYYAAFISLIYQFQTEDLISGLFVIIGFMNTCFSISYIIGSNKESESNKKKKESKHNEKENADAPMKTTDPQNSDSTVTIPGQPPFAETDLSTEEEPTDELGPGFFQTDFKS